MECKKFALPLVAMAMVLLAAMPSTVTAARNEAMPFSIINTTNIRNPFAGILSIDKPVNYCYPRGSWCASDYTCCSGNCNLLPGDPPIGTCA
ncbi:hypothetical protein V6N13_062651 [Hibiscus sabdariffa]